MPAKTSRKAGNGSAALTPKRVAAMRSDFESNPAYRIAQNAVTQVSVDKIANRRDVVASADHSFSVRLDDWKVTDQKQSGRCWLFAGLNLLRAGAMKKMGLKSFEFSQNFLLYWDKLEKANHFLEAMIELAERDPDDRTVAFLLGEPISDGGQWNMFVNLIRKHGLVPKAAMPETESSSSTGAMNRMLLTKLRQGATALRGLSRSGASLGTVRALKDEILGEVHRILCIHLGTPPERFVWQWMDKKRKFHRNARMTPRAFAKRYVTLPVEDYVCLVNDPRPSSPFGRTFTVQYLGNVVGGGIVRYLNVEIGVMKKIAMRALQDGEPVWFGCDVAQQMDREQGIWDAGLRDYESLYGASFDFPKADRLVHGHAKMTHAMLFTGVDIVGGKPRRWRVENSWGEKGGNSGFYLMNDSWFDEHMFEIAARRKYLPPKLRKAADRKPIVLPPWDPMGSLAR